MPTLLALRQALARAMGDLEVVGTTSATGTTVVSPSLQNATANASTGRYNGHWLYVSTGTGIGQQRVVTTNGYDPATGTLTVNTAWATNPSASTLEISRWFPAIPEVLVGTTDYRTIINRALSMLVVPDEITLSVTTSDEYALTTWQAWLDRPERLVRVLEPSPLASRAPIEVPPRGWELVLDAQLPKLRTQRPFSASTGNLTLQVRRPANTWIAVASTWGESAVGLSADTDEAKPTVADVVTVALAEAYQVLLHRSVGAPNGPWLELWQAQRELARGVKYYDRSLEREPDQAPAPVAA